LSLKATVNFIAEVDKRVLAECRPGQAEREPGPITTGAHGYNG